MNPETFAQLKGQASNKTGLRQLPQFLPQYYGFDIRVLDVHQRCSFNFAVILGGKYTEFKTIRSAHTGIRAHLRGAI